MIGSTLTPWVQHQASALGINAGLGQDLYQGQRGTAQRPFEITPWFQAILDSLWPQISGAVEHELLRGSVAKKLSKAVPGLHFASAQLGATPPQLYGVRTLPGEQKASMCTIFDFGFQGGDSINICVGLGPLRASLAELSFRGRICVNFVGLKPRKPVVSGLRIFFPNVPTLSFSFGGLASLMPIHPDKLRELVLKMIADKIVLPAVKTVHIDALTRQHEELGFLPYHVLHSPAPHGLLRMTVTSLDGLTFSPYYYVNVRVGGQQKSTESLADLGGQGYSGWARSQLDFVVDLFLDQDLQVELFERGHLMAAVDRLIARGAISMVALESQFRTSMRTGSLPTARVEVHPPLGNGRAGLITMVGSYFAMTAGQSRGAGDEEFLLQIVVDCVSGLHGAQCDKKYSIRARVSGSQRPGAITDVSSAVKAAGRGVVASARVSAQGIEDMLFGEVKERIRFLMSKGGKWTAEEICFILPGMVPPDVAARLMREIQQEGKVQGEMHAAVEILFEQQLRLEVQNPASQALRIELVREGIVEGALEWSNLAWLAGQNPMEDNMQAYRFQTSELASAKIYLKRTLLHSPGAYSRLSQVPPRPHPR